METPTLKLLLGGDLMLGRGIDLRMPQHGKTPAHDEQGHGPLPASFEPTTPWGQSLAWMEQFQPDLRLVNLETAITRSNQAWPGKAVHVRLHPANISVLHAARIDGCSLANNHSLDWGYTGLAETLHCLRRAGIQSAGAGLSPHQAQRPARWQLADGQQLLLFAWAFTSSGVPPAWAAEPNHPGLALLSGINSGSVKWLCRCINRQRRPGDRVVVSLHWGANWVPVVPEQHRWLARQLIELAGVDVVFGHSSHHPLPLEIHQGRLILYGCGDLINDSEDVPPHAPWRSDLVCLYGLKLERTSGALAGLELRPFQLRGFQLQEASAADHQLLSHQLGLEASPLGWRCRRHGNGWQLEPRCGDAAAIPAQAHAGQAGHP